jgi:hypothetical protein
MKLAVIVATYHRPNGTSPQKLLRMFDCLSQQTYGDFTLYLIGDDYQPQEEFYELAKHYQKPIYLYNNPQHYRKHFKGRNLWRIAGSLARSYGIDRAIEDGFDYYLHLDDDDQWKPFHVQKVVDCLQRFPQVDFIVTKSIYSEDRPGNFVLPRTTIGPLDYDNYRLKPEDSAHSSWTISLKTFGQDLKQIHHQRRAAANRARANPALKIRRAVDFLILQHAAQRQNKKTLKAICIPEITLIKTHN